MLAPKAAFNGDQGAGSPRPFPSTTSLEDFIMAEINKLSVGQALEKLRGTKPLETKMTRVDGSIDTLDDEIRRLRATNRRLERDQRAASAQRSDLETIPRRVKRGRTIGIMIGIIVVIAILV